MPHFSVQALGPEYERLFGSMVVSSSRLADADARIDRVVGHQSVYEAVMQATGVPWQIIGTFHSLEGDLNFQTHLHNGDPLTARTVHVPVGRPRTGQPPFTFAESAIDALQHEGFARQDDWGLAATLFRLEKYNGFGYRRQGINSPYLWSFSSHYRSGKFVETLVDGRPKSTFDPGLVSRQCGGAVILKRMVERQVLSFGGVPRPLEVVLDGSPTPSVAAFVEKGNSWITPRPLAQLVPDLHVLAVRMDPFTITLSYRERPSGDLQTQVFPARLFRGQGYVDASDLVRDLLGKRLALVSPDNPSRLEITS